MAKVPPWQLPGPAPQGASGGSGQLGTPGVRPSHGVPSHRPGGSSERPPKSPILLPLSVRHRVKSRRYRYRHRYRHRVKTLPLHSRYRHRVKTVLFDKLVDEPLLTLNYALKLAGTAAGSSQSGLWSLAVGIWSLAVARCALPVARCPLPVARCPLPLPALCCFPCHGSLRGLPAAHCSSPRLLHALRRRA